MKLARKALHIAVRGFYDAIVHDLFNGQGEQFGVTVRLDVEVRQSHASNRAGSKPDSSEDDRSVQSLGLRRQELGLQGLPARANCFRCHMEKGGYLQGSLRWDSPAIGGPLGHEPWTHSDRLGERLMGVAALAQ